MDKSDTSDAERPVVGIGGRTALTHVGISKSKQRRALFTHFSPSFCRSANALMVQVPVVLANDRDDGYAGLYR